MFPRSWFADGWFTPDWFPKTGAEQTVRGRGFRGAGRRVIRMLAEAELSRDAELRVRLARQEARRRIVENTLRIARQRFDEELAHHRKMAEIATYSILMAEV